MIFVLRVVIFSILILTGFWISVQSVTVRKVVTVVYLLTLFWYTFGCRMTTITGTPVYGSDPGPAVAEPTTWERFVQLIKTIFGSQPDGTLAGGGVGKAMVFNVMLFVPLGYLILLWISQLRKSRHGRVAAALICMGVSIIIEAVQSITGLGMADIKDVFSNTLGGLIGVLMVMGYERRKRAV